MNMTENLSRKIKVVSYWAMFSVILIHSHSLPDKSNTVVQFIQMFFTRSLTDWAVPFFFLVSGYFFAAKYRGDVIAFWKKKMWTLLMPYFAWALLGTIFCLPMICFNNYITGRWIWSRSVFDSATSIGVIDNLIGITRNGPIGNLALWYVRALIVFFVFAPLWHAINCTSRWILPLCGFSLAIILPETWIPYIAIKTGSFGWFFLGIGACNYLLEEKRVPCWLEIVAAALYPLFAASISLNAANVVRLNYLAPWIKAAIPFFGVVFWWGLFDRFADSQNSWKKLPNRYGQTFWVYCIHATFTSYYMATCFFLFGKSNVISLVVLATTPVVGLYASLCSANLVKHYARGTYLFLTGGR